MIYKQPVTKHKKMFKFTKENNYQTYFFYYLTGKKI